MSRTWLILVARLPAQPARHRMAVWRELRRAGAVPLAQGAWAVPDVPAVQPVVERVRQRTTAAGATLLTLTAAGHEIGDMQRLEQLYRQAREEEWAEFAADCGKYLAELDKEHRTGKYTLAELDEEDQSLERLRRWYRDLRGRDLLGTPARSEADERLKGCTEAFEDYAEHVYAAAAGQTPQTTFDQ